MMNGERGIVNLNEIVEKRRIEAGRFMIGVSSKQEKDKRLAWLMNLINDDDHWNEYQVYKALVCLKNLASDWNTV